MGFSLLVALFSWISLAAQEDEPPKSPQEIQKELDEDQRLYERALKMFNPWYAGPLLTGSASMMPPGMMNTQPYAFVTDNYSRFNGERDSVDVPNTIQFKPLSIFQAGIASWLDAFLSIQAVGNWQSGKQGGGLGDSSLALGFSLYKQTVYVPAFKLVIQETFPTGRYRNLNPTNLGLDGIGAGSFQTAIGLNIGKLVFWDTPHPVNLRLQVQYVLPSTVRVKNFNSYGGGFNTDGSVRPGQSLNISQGTEITLTQRWVLANDIVYTSQGRTRFTGNPGTTATGEPATVGSPSSDSLSLAPAIEYNPNPNLGWIGGVWFSVWGRNTENFIAGVLSVTYTFSIL